MNMNNEFDHFFFIFKGGTSLRVQPHCWNWSSSAPSRLQSSRMASWVRVGFDPGIYKVTTKYFIYLYYISYLKYLRCSH